MPSVGRGRGSSPALRLNHVGIDHPVWGGDVGETPKREEGPCIQQTKSFLAIRARGYNLRPVTQEPEPRLFLAFVETRPGVEKRGSRDEL
jgi:hypothetical protein